MFEMRKIIYILSVLLIIISQQGRAEANENVSTTTVAVSTSTPLTVEQQVRSYFVDIPVMIDIARCESNFRQFNDSGSLLRGGGGEFVGIFQIYESAHAKSANALGFNLETVVGNMSYAKHLYEQSGTSPWVSCVPKVVTNTSAVTNTDAERKEKIKLLSQIILLLKQVVALQAQLAGM